MTQRFNLENSYCNFSNYKKFLLFDKIFNLINKFDVSPYLDEDLDPFEKKIYLIHIHQKYQILH